MFERSHYAHRATRFCQSLFGGTFEHQIRAQFWYQNLIPNFLKPYASHCTGIVVGVGFVISVVAVVATAGALRCPLALLVGGFEIHSEIFTFNVGFAIKMHKTGRKKQYNKILPFSSTHALPWTVVTSLYVEYGFRKTILYCRSRSGGLRRPEQVLKAS